MLKSAFHNILTKLNDKAMVRKYLPFSPSFVSIYFTFAPPPTLFVGLSSLKFPCRFLLFPIMYYYGNQPVRPCPVFDWGPAGLFNGVLGRVGLRSLNAALPC
jgi:hypothetical protein